jgi:hypothetical protein
MAEDAFRPERKKVAPQEEENPLERSQAARRMIEEELGEAGATVHSPKENPLEAMKKSGILQGNVPPHLQKMMGGPPKAQQRFRNSPSEAMLTTGGSSELATLLQGLKEQQTIFEEVTLPSLGKFYGDEGPVDGKIHIRPMTGEEEMILATPRFVRKGVAINMIFQRCMQDKFRPDDLLTADRTYLLIYLRGISYSPSYDVEVKCPGCEKKFATVIDLNSLYVDTCPDDFGPDLSDVLPKSGYKFTYRLSRGRDETEIQEYRDRRIKMWGDSAADDTLTYRTAQLLENIEGVTSKSELQTLIKNLPIQDVAYIRNCVNDPPFGVDTNVPINCPSCMSEFEVDLPLEANFFFPRRKKKEKSQV